MSNSLIAAVRRAALATTLAGPLVPSVHALHAQGASQVARGDGAGRQYLSAGLRGFEVRRHAGFGHFITDSILRASEGQRLAHVMSTHIPSLIFGLGGVGGEYPVSSRVCGGGFACAAPRCYARVFVDGSLLYDGSPGRRDVEGFDVARSRTEDWSAIEFYDGPGGLPAQFAGDRAECGTMLLWSRET